MCPRFPRHEQGNRLLRAHRRFARQRPRQAVREGLFDVLVNASLHATQLETYKMSIPCHRTVGTSHARVHRR